ncbi:hypothetical protein J2S17_005587, partial [Cytobacillus purgationiresistens]|nr:hypothetical protein [Cytobacillus purgationiresistens]
DLVSVGKLVCDFNKKKAGIFIESSEFLAVKEHCRYNHIFADIIEKSLI